MVRFHHDYLRASNPSAHLFRPLQMYDSGEIGPLEGYRRHSFVMVSLNNHDSLHQPINLLPVYPAPRVVTYLYPRIIHLASGSYHRREIEPLNYSSLIC